MNYPISPSLRRLHSTVSTPQSSRRLSRCSRPRRNASATTYRRKSNRHRWTAPHSKHDSRRSYMQYRTLGLTGIKVSPYALGALMLGASIGNPDHDDSTRLIHKALDAGINLIDTADAYSQGASEEVVGKALKGRRDSVVLATKFGLPMGDDLNRRGTSRRWIMTEVENSLRRLQTDYTDIEETLSALSDLIHSGKVRAIGSSMTPASDIIAAQWVAERRGLERFRTEQPCYSILNRSIESEVLPVAQRYGMGVLVWGPLGQGMLTGRVRKGQQTDLVRATLGM